jgi:hypothetical protein
MPQFKISDEENLMSEVAFKMFDDDDFMLQLIF